MSKSQVYQKDSTGSVDFNMTPMIDVTFQLIIFFILAGQMASQELAQLKLHKPHESQAIEDKEVDKSGGVVINIVSAGADKEAEDNPIMASQAKEYRIGSTAYALGDPEFAKKLQDLKKGADKATEGTDKKPYVEIRSDYRVAYAQVMPVMILAADAGFHKMNLTALVKTGE